jgi:predicted nucleic acid-binding protein
LALPVDERVALRAGELMAEASKLGRPRSTEDLLIAATGLQHGLTLVTHNRAHFEDIGGLRVEDWMT